MTFRVVSGAFALLFLFSASLQFNDPDPVGWVLVYGAVAAVSAAVSFGARPRLATCVVLAAVAVAFAFWAPSLEHFSLGALQSFGMSGSIEEEEVREALGLGIAGVWLAALATVLLRSRE